MTHEDEQHLDQVDRLLAATLFLMSGHATTPCPRIACMVARHLECIARHPGAGDRVATICRQLAARWFALQRLEPGPPSTAH